MYQTMNNQEVAQGSSIQTVKSGFNIVQVYADTVSEWNCS